MKNKYDPLTGKPLYVIGTDPYDKENNTNSVGVSNGKIINKKYYTPKVEEFHVGFNYEILLPDSKYHKKIFGVDKINHPELEEFKDELMAIAHAIVRVKYLDIDDIESIGFELDQCVKADCFFVIGNMIQGDYTLVFNRKSKHIQIFSMSGNKSLSSFYGIIQNISELKIVLKQLEILFKES